MQWKVSHTQRSLHEDLTKQNRTIFAEIIAPLPHPLTTTGPHAIRSAHKHTTFIVSQET